MVRSGDGGQNMWPVDHTRHHREKPWDYKGRAIYHITLATEGRVPIFGSLTGATEKDAFIALTSLGKFVWTTFRNLPSFYAKKGIKIKILAVRVMPDHLHGVIHVQEPMSKSIGEIIRSFKSACTSWYKREIFQNSATMLNDCTHSYHSGNALLQFCRIFANRGSIWEYIPAGYHERILHCDGQLDHMIKYVKDNPRRLWLKRHNPHLFKINNDYSWTFTDDCGNCHEWRFRTLGNIFLMNSPHKQLIQCSRSISNEDLEIRCADWLHFAEMGMVSVTAAISEGEKRTARLLREAGHPLVVLLKDGFPKIGSEHEKHYKPGGVYFNACAAGKLLLIEPYKEVLDDPLIQEAVYRKSPMAPKDSNRYHFLTLNAIGSTLTTIPLQ